MRPIPIFDVKAGDVVTTSRYEALHVTRLDGFCVDVKTGAFRGYRPGKRLVIGRWRPRA